MFYETTIKAVTQSGVIDVQGRSLSFIGYLPVKAGDTVFTDGRFIFGNAPPKGAPAIFDTPSGIPVLGDYDSSGEDELRGYFTNRGKFKKYSIAQDDWITNSKKFFNHGEEFFDEDKVIDADVTDKGDELIVTGGIYHDSRTLDAAYVTMPVNDYRLFFYDRHEWTIIPTVCSIQTLTTSRTLSAKFTNRTALSKNQQ